MERVRQRGRKSDGEARQQRELRTHNRGTKRMKGAERTSAQVFGVGVCSGHIHHTSLHFTAPCAIKKIYMRIYLFI